MAVANITGFVNLGTSFVYSFIINTLKGTSREQELIRYVFENAKENDAESVLNTIDKFGYTKQFLVVSTSDLYHIVLEMSIIDRRLKLRIIIESGRCQRSISRQSGEGKEPKVCSRTWCLLWIFCHQNCQIIGTFKTL
jgi:hypothetical protein